MKIGYANIMGSEDTEKGRKKAEREKKKKATGKAANKISKLRAAKSKTKPNSTFASESKTVLRETEAAGMSIFPQQPAVGPVSALRSGQDQAVLARHAWPVEWAGDGTPWQAPVARMY